MIASASRLAILLSFPFAFSTAQASEYVGYGRFLTGDSFKLCIEGSVPKCRPIRLCGIDAPEEDDPAVYMARAAMLDLLLGSMDTPIRCIPVGEGTVCDGRPKLQSEGYLVAQCFTAKEGDMAAYLVKKGAVCDWAKYSGGHYSKNGDGEACADGPRK
jgi:endonuclease YncB( thermonuclease family)